MPYQKIFKTGYIEKLAYKLAEGDLQSYQKKDLDFAESELLTNENLNIEKQSDLKIGNFLSGNEFENSKTFFEAYKFLTPEQASDARFWTYLTHVTYRKYMQKKRLPKWLFKELEREKSVRYILQHWFIYPLNAKNLLRNDMALLWWGTYITFDPNRKDPYELTKELFSMQDYTRHFETRLGRNYVFVRGFLDFVITNKKLFSKYKEAKVRFLMRTMNCTGGYKLISSLSEEEVKNLLGKYTNDLEKIKTSK